MKRTDSGCWVIENALDAQMMIRVVEQNPGYVVGLDVETAPSDGKRKTPKPWLDHLLGVGLAFYEDEPLAFDAEAKIVFYVVWNEETAPFIRRAVARRKWYAHNAMFDASVLRHYGVHLGEHVGDPRIIAYLLGQPEAGLKPLLVEYMNRDTIEYQALLEQYDAADLRGVPLEVVAEYCGSQDAEQVVRLERLMRSELETSNPRAFDVYTKVELPMVQILVDMTEKGIRFDREAAQERLTVTQNQRRELDLAIDALVKADGFLEYEKRGGKIWHPTCQACRNGKKKRETCEACGGRGKFDPVPMPFNAGSWQQRGRFLYEHLGLPKKRFAGNVQPWQIAKGWYDPEEVAGSTDALAMLQMKDRHPVIPLLIVRARVAKDESFLVKWMELSEADGRLHTQFTNTTVASGRLSSFEPNLQQVTMRFRDMFLADEKTVGPYPEDDIEWVIVAGDYSQLELVIAAYMSRDPVMIEIIRNGWDMHRITAEAVYSVPWREVAKDSPMRATSKVANYLSNYLGQKQKLQEGIEKLALSQPEMGIVVPDLDECARILFAHKRKYAGYWAWVDMIKARTRALGYSETAFGRPRYFPDILSDNAEYRGEAERAAVNHAIQGTAADLMKMAQVNISRDEVLTGWGYPVLQVHDEGVSIVDKRYAEAYAMRLRSHMELGQPFEPIVPLTVDVQWGATWAETHK